LNYRTFAAKVGGRIAARSDRAARALHSIDQKTIAIADFRGQLPLTE
jgi:hypothetical protein